MSRGKKIRDREYTIFNWNKIKFVLVHDPHSIIKLRVLDIVFHSRIHSKSLDCGSYMIRLLVKSRYPLQD